MKLAVMTTNSPQRSSSKAPFVELLPCWSAMGRLEFENERLMSSHQTGTVFAVKAGTRLSLVSRTEDMSTASEGMQSAWPGLFWLSVSCAVAEAALGSARATGTLPTLTNLSSRARI